MALTVTAFRARWRAFANETSYPEEYVDAVLLEALPLVSAAYFGSSVDAAQGHLAAHFLEMSKAQRAAGVQSVGAGPASVTYAQLAGPEMLAMTGYGNMYLTLLRAKGPASQLL